MIRLLYPLDSGHTIMVENSLLASLLKLIQGQGLAEWKTRAVIADY